MVFLYALLHFLLVDSSSLLCLAVVVKLFLILHICFYLCFSFYHSVGCLILPFFPTVLLQHFFCFVLNVPNPRCPPLAVLSGYLPTTVFFPPYFCLFFRLFLYPPSNPAPLQV